MSVITWITPRGDLGTIPENTFYSYQLEAVDSSQQDLFYSFISGNLPGGMYVTRTGELRGIPTILSSVNQTFVSTFTIRATNPNGDVADRTFSVTVSNINGPQIIPKPDFIGAWFDGNFLDYTFNAVNDNPNAVQTWSIIDGDIPLGTTFDSNGRLSGYVSIIAQNITSLGFEAAPIESVIYDALPISTDRFYNFTVQADDGFKTETYNVRLLIVSKGNYTADNSLTLINNSFIKVDADNSYRPIILNNPSSLPIVVAGNTFAYKFIAYDPEDEDVKWKIDELEFSGMDDLDAAAEQTIIGNGTSGPYSMSQSPLNAARIVVQVNGVLYTAYTDYTTAGNQLTFVSLTPGVTDTIYIQFIAVNTGYDSILFDQGASGLPSGLSINQSTGWVIGVLPDQTESFVTYSFIVIAYRTSNINEQSDPVTFSLTVKQTINEEIIWTTARDLGTIDNGAVSEISISAYNTLGKELVYSLIYAPFRKIPQGLKFLQSGQMVGRTSFRYFSLDGQSATINVTSTQDLTVGMTVQGVGVAQGCRLTAIVDANTIEVRPAIYVTQGSILVFTNDLIQKAVSTTTNAISTVIDSGTTTFDQQCGFTIKATSIDGTISATKEFTIIVRPRNLAPYENVYFKALPSYTARNSWANITKDETIFPSELIYRPDDTYFGVQQSFKSLFLSGLAASTAETFVSAINRNHYFKRLNFGQIKTARAVNENGDVDYEVVYVDLIDEQSFGTAGPPLEVQLTIANSFLFNNQAYNIIYPNSFPNMQKRLENGIGYTNRSTLPGWMTSVQEDGMVLGLIRCVVLAYTKPGASKLIAYRLENSGFEINSIPFIADRYQWDNYLSRFYNTETNSFEPSVPTTFDKYPTITQGSAIIDTIITNTVTNSNVITIPNNINIGYGWTVQSRSANLSIPENTTISNYNSSGNVLSITSNINVQAGQSIRINGEASVDYAVSTPFSTIDGENLSAVRDNFLIDGVREFNQRSKIIFAQQYGYGGINDGWINSSGQAIPGYLSKVSGASVINQQGGVWELTWTEFAELGFDDNSIGFDEEGEELNFSHFDQGNDAEVKLTFLLEIIVNQTVKVRTGDTYKVSTLQYQTFPGQIIPSYFIFQNPTGIFRTAETTFDGGTCVVREGFTAGNSFAGGTTFGSNKDIWIVPESLDKYIKFPQIGVFV
jgi:hypothetical protein